MHTVHSKLLLVSLIMNCSCVSGDVWDFIFGPKLKSYDRSVEIENNTHDYVKELTEAYGYPLEIHHVTNSQGYMLTLHRLPFGRKSNTTKRSRPIVLLHPGLFGSAECFLFRGPQHDLPYLLADSGYDMWIINNRGSSYSKGHVKLNSQHDRSFWDFSFHELGVYDLPASIDYILNVTKKRDLFYIGYSMGASVGYVLCSLKPEYNARIRHFINLAPSTNVVHKLAPAHKIAFSVLPSLIETLDKQNIMEILPRRLLATELLTNLCQNGSSTQPICIAILFLIVGVDYEQLNPGLFPYIFKYFPNGSSLKTIDHYLQVMISGVFKEYDYGIENNKITYGENVPPIYNLSKVATPTSIYYGGGDFFSTEADCKHLAKRLPNFIELYKIPLENFNHMDFMWAVDVRNLLYDRVLNLLNKYK